jgi:hypothetical protein
VDPNVLPVPGGDPKVEAQALKPAFQPRPRPQPWTFALGAGVGYEHNIDFVVPDGPSGTAVTPRGEVSRAFGSDRGQLVAIAGGRLNNFPSQDQETRYYADLSLAGEYQSSARTSWRANAGYSRGNTDTAIILIQQGTALPLVETKSFAGGLELDQLLARRTTLKLAGRFFRTDFQAPGFIDGESVRGTLSLDRQFSNRDTGSIVYAIEDVLTNEVGRSYYTHYGSFQWGRFVRPRTAVLLEAGLSYTPDAVAAGQARQENFFGGVSVNHQIRRSQFTAFFRREVSPAFGFGASLLVSRFGLSTAVPMGHDWRMQLQGFITRPDRPADPALAYAGYADTFLSIGRRVSRRVEVTAETRYRHRGEARTLPSMSSFKTGLYVTLISPAGKERPAGWLN